MNKTSLVICSCDAYKDIWHPFFTLLKRNWSDLEFPVVLNTESLTFSFEDLEISTFSLEARHGKMSWSERLFRTLEIIDSKYVIILLDDYLLESQVDSSLIAKCIEYMENDQEIASFSFKEQPGPNYEDNKCEGFSLRGKTAPYRLSAQASIWRKSMLMKYLRPHESAWQFEVWGSIRSRRYPWKLYCSNSERTNAFDYCNGRIIIRGKYYRPDVERIQKKLNIKLYTEERGFTDYDLENMPSRTFRELVSHYIKLKTYSDVVKSLM